MEKFPIYCRKSRNLTVFEADGVNKYPFFTITAHWEPRRSRRDDQIEWWQDWEFLQRGKAGEVLPAAGEQRRAAGCWCWLSWGFLEGQAGGVLPVAEEQRSRCSLPRSHPFSAPLPPCLGMSSWWKAVFQRTKFYFYSLLGWAVSLTSKNFNLI